MTVDANGQLSNRDLGCIFLFTLSLIIVLLFVAGYGFGYDLFWQQMGAAVIFYLTTLGAISAIIKKGIPLMNFFQFFFLSLIVIFPLVAYMKVDHPPLLIDDFEAGIEGWVPMGGTGVNSTIQEESRRSPFGSWHLVWSVKNCCQDAGGWAAIERIACPPETFSLREYRYIEFWYKTENGEHGFNVEIRSPDWLNKYVAYAGPSTKWTRMSLILPRENDLGNFTAVGQPAPENCHVLFANSCNDTYHFDQIQLISPTVLAQHPFLTAGAETLLVVLTVAAFIPAMKSRFKRGVRHLH